MVKINNSLVYNDALTRWSSFEDYMGELDGNKTRREIMTAPPSLFVEELAEKSVPKENWWNDDKINTTKALRIPVGYLDGDKTRPYIIEYGDNGDVHGILVGGTGSGKSITFYALAGALGKIYSPRTLRIWFADFKRVTFSQFLPNDVNPERLPHMEACVCTTDITYATSFFAGYQNLMEQYSQMFQKNPYLPKDDPYYFTTDSIKDWNKKWDDIAKKKGPQYLKYKVPRHILFVDEFGSLFIGADSEMKKNIFDSLEAVAKKGRSMGFHMLLSSQTPDDIPEEAFKQSTFRLCLQVIGNPDMSTKLLGDDRASKVTQKYGIGFARGKGFGSDPNFVYKLAVPILKQDLKSKLDKDGNKVQGLIPYLYERAKSEKFEFPKLITYDDQDPVAWFHLDGDYNEIVEAFKDDKDVSLEDMFVFGRLMVYDPDQTMAYNRFFRNDQKANIYAQFNDTSDLLNFTHTLIYNIKRNNHDFVIFSSAGKNIDDYLLVNKLREEPDDLRSMPYPNVVEQLSLLEQERLKSGNRKPIWFVMLGYDKDMDFGVQPNENRDLQKMFAKLLTRVGSVGIHVAIVCTGKHIIQDILTDACTTVISDLIDADDSSSLFKRGNIASTPSGELKNNYLVIKDITEVVRARMYTYDGEHGTLVSRGIKR